ncbi:type II toxin-antitoxin system PemK/MazF family toxin [Sodalis ligni]|uniref:type II toxin-antitoxin system PemK/MazF family toxin n=1 Tax=Sodalis ligni TaxID=2697027 RepID=UPI00193FCF53|nr:type II toxin-antitoxin system PemK/MazF family toxin [Sodalis ligni]QWA12049.1 type II toxin-antitoxin system PemK/MazF family toxin [Sodalis ligni]
MVQGRIPRKGDIWHFDPDPVFGRELKGKHYCILITEEALNRALGVAICCPLSTLAVGARSAGDKDGRFHNSSAPPALISLEAACQGGPAGRPT